MDLGRPRSKITVIIDSACVVSYSTSIDAIITCDICHCFFKYFMSKFHDLELVRFKVIWFKVHSANQIPLPVWLTWIFWISTKNNRYSHLLRNYLAGKFGEDWWKIATCRAFNSFA